MLTDAIKTTLVLPDAEQNALFQKVLELIPTMCEESPAQTFYMNAVTFSNQRRSEFNDMFQLTGPKHETYQFDGEHRLLFEALLYPFSLGAAQLRGRTRLFVLVDSMIYDDFMHSMRDETSEQHLRIASFMRCLHTTAHRLNVKPEQLIFKV